MTQTARDRPSQQCRKRTTSDFTRISWQIAREYQAYGRVDSDARLAPFDCRAPSTYLRVPRVSKSTDESTHGKKVYYLYAKSRQAYRDLAKSADQRGQVLVKETWQALSVEPRGQNEKKLAPEAKDVHQFFVPGEAGALFVMYRNEDAKLNEATDEGWVYGTISVDRKAVSSAGRVASCMRCHHSAPHGRLFGLRALPPNFLKDQKTGEAAHREVREQ